MKLVLVEWVDSHSSSNAGWRRLADIADDGGEATRCRSVGWLVSDSGDCKVIVPHLSGDTQKSTVPYGRGELTIPNKAIVSLCVLQKK